MRLQDYVCTYIKYDVRRCAVDKDLFLPRPNNSIYSPTLVMAQSVKEKVMNKFKEVEATLGM